MKILVLAGGFGTRLQSVVSNVPKALAPIGSVPFLHLQLQHWIDQGVKSFVFLLHHQSDLIINFLKLEQHRLLQDCDVQWLVEPKPLDTGGAVAFAVERLHLAGDFLVTNADTWLGSGIKDMCQATAPAMAVVELSDVSRYGRVQLGAQNRVTAFHEKNGCAEVGYINAGLYLLNAALFKDWDHLPFSMERVAFPAWLARENLKAVSLNTDFIDIGVPDDYFRFCYWIETDRKGALCS
jgi:D-glycero-alpha-D-manno-heptose 1-phosphate guanylyltransferase